MCGIAGIIKKSVEGKSLTDALLSMKHRGPDSNGQFTDEPLHLLHTRLAIQDLSHNAHQPMQSSDGQFVLVFNGEIYNHQELRAELALNGYSFKSDSDSETLLYSYIHFREDILERLNGIFAFAIYDRAKRHLFAARDRFGVKPFYYYRNNDVFTFASEIKTIQALDSIEPELDINILYESLILQWSMGEHTGFKKIKKLLPGHSLELYIDHLDSLKINKWSKEIYSGEYYFHNEDEWVSLLDNALNKAVQRQLLSDKPIAYFLSGGLDSSLLLAIAHQIDASKANQGFTIDPGESFSKEGFSNDLAYAKLVAQHLNINLDIIQATPNFLEDFDKMIAHLDEAQGDIAPLLVQKIAHAAKLKGFDVLIGGVGADDIFSGYRRHQALAYEPAIQTIPLWLRKLWSMTSNLLSENMQTRRFKKLSVNIAKEPLERIMSYFHWADSELILSLFSKEYQTKINENGIADYFLNLLSQIPKEDNLLNQVLQLEMNSFLPNHNLNYTDKMGMAESVEIRVPYLDNDLVSLVAKIPPKLKMKGTNTKYLLKKVAEKYLPKEVIYRSKTGFGAPIRTWTQEDKTFQQEVWKRLNDDSFLSRNIFNKKAINLLFEETINKKKDHSYTLLVLLAIESWLRQFYK